MIVMAVNTTHVDRCVLEELRQMNRKLDQLVEYVEEAKQKPPIDPEAFLIDLFDISDDINKARKTKKKITIEKDKKQ